MRIIFPYSLLTTIKWKGAWSCCEIKGNFGEFNAV